MARLVCQGRSVAAFVGPVLESTPLSVWIL